MSEASISTGSQLNKCSHGVHLPVGETIARDLNGREYCTVCHWDANERRRSYEIAPIYRQWPLLERRHQPSITAPFGVERFIHLDAEPATFHLPISDDASCISNVQPAEQDAFRKTMNLFDGYYHSVRDENGKQRKIRIDRNEASLSLRLETKGTSEPFPSLLGFSKKVHTTDKKILPRLVAPVPKKSACSVPRWAAIGPQEFCASWFGPRWVAPSFTVIPKLILDHSQKPVAKPLTNFCPTCFEVRNGVTRYGMYVPQLHDCGEWLAA